MKGQNHKDSNFTQEEISEAEARRKEAVERFKKLKGLKDSDYPYSFKSKTTAAILAWFLGFFGIHRLYIGKTGTGVTMLIIGVLTFLVALTGNVSLTVFLSAIVAIWAIIDFITIICGSMTDGDGKPIKE